MIKKKNNAITIFKMPAIHSILVTVIVAYA